MSKEHPYFECSSFDICSAPKCPLDPQYEERFKYPEEDKCKARKRTRLQIGKKYPEVLKYKGLTPREFAGYKLAGTLGDLIGG